MIFHKVLDEVSNRKNRLIGKDVGIEEEYSIYRSLRRGYTTQAMNIGVSELDITNTNI